MNQFVGRQTEIIHLEEFFHSKVSARREVFVIHGFGGMGKTQLAVEFARKHHSRYSSVFWLEGFSEDQLKQSIANAARRLPQDEVKPFFSEELRSPNIDVDRVVEGFYRWLSQPTNKNWLLIIDNVDRDYHSKIRDPQAYDLKEYLPPADHGSILITSRLASLEEYGSGLKLGMLDDEHAKIVLEKTAGKAIKGE